MPTAADKRFVHFLQSLGYANARLKASGVFRHEIKFSQSSKATTSVPIDFFYITSSSLHTTLFSIQEKVWNSNELHTYVVVTDDKTFVFNGKIKPDKDNLFKEKIDEFPSGVQVQSMFPVGLEKLEKNSLDGGYFFEFFIQKRKKNRESEVDKDLLLNLIALRRDMIQLFDDKEEKTIHLLILRCLFLKYLEDRGIYESGYVVNVLEAGNLLRAFDDVAKINGDIFKNEVLGQHQIHNDYLILLAKFFKSDYLTGQGRLFPYRFDYIPIQLISHVYEAFLSNAKKKGKGIYYTPKFVVDFMLSQTLLPELNVNEKATLLDPSCGSGAFLVEGYKAIVAKRKAEKDFEQKKAILQEQIFGIDNDAEALRIATFSLYLALLEGLDADFIKHQIENQSPILPSLIGKNLVRGNTLLEDTIFKSKTFHCIVGNPPWGSVPDDEIEEHQMERAAIGGKNKVGKIPEYKTVSDYQRSQAFLLRVKKWSSDKTSFCLIVNNSTFLNEEAKDFRKELLQQYRIKTFYELSNLNEILFQKKQIGDGDNKVEIGATEPCAVIVFDNQATNNNVVTYISPKLNIFSKALALIHYGDYDTKKIEQNDLIHNDNIWRVFVNGGWEDYEVIKSIEARRSRFPIECHRGFEPLRNAVLQEETLLRTIITSDDFDRYSIKPNLGKFNWNQSKRRMYDEKLFLGERILIAYRPKKSDNFKLRCVFVKDDIVFKNDIVCFQIQDKTHYLYCLAILNSSLIGYYLFNISAQWQGGLKREVLRNYDIVNIPFPEFKINKSSLSLEELVISINQQKSKVLKENIENRIDEIVYDSYGLLDFEREIIKEFYDINVHRVNAKVETSDIEAYFKKFKEIYESVLAENLALEGTYKISPNMGAFIVFQIKERHLASDKLKISTVDDTQILKAIKNRQLEEAYYSNRLNEQKTKVYEEERFFIIKSNFFKDWTVRQAIKDANEEIQILTEESMNG